MSLCTWARSNAEYSRALVQSGVRGARSGGEAYLNGEPLQPFLRDSLRSAFAPALMGACLGMLGSFPGRKGRRLSRVVGLGILGGAVGLGAGVLWKSRGLTAYAADAAFKNLGKVRDAHWLEQHPIDYA